MSGTIQSNLHAPSIGRPPMPREHGAWVMLLTPMIVGLAGVTPFSPAAAALLVVAVLAAFMAQNAASVLLKPRAPQTAAYWLGLFTTVMALSGLALVCLLGRWSLVWLALPAVALFLLHVKLLRGPAADRLDRTLWGELLATGALTLTGPAAYVAMRGTLDVYALGLWLASVVAFASGVFHVNMRLDAVKVRTPFTWATRWQLGKGLVAFHVALLAALVAAVVLVPGPIGWVLAIAYAPLVVRGGWEFVRLNKGVPSFKAIGIRETVLTTWFALGLVAVLRLLA